MGSLRQYTTTILIFALIAICISYALFEFRLPGQNSQDYQVKATLSVQEASQRFNAFLFEFTAASTEFASLIEDRIITDNNFRDLPDFDFWGVSVYKEGNPRYWNNFASIPPLDSTLLNSTEVRVSTSRDNNVHFLYSRIPILFTEGTDSTFYHVFTSRKITQENILSIGKELDLNASQLFNKKGEFPIRFSLVQPTESSILSIDSVSTISSQTAGFIYASEEDIHAFWKQTTQQFQTTRAVYLLGILILMSLFFIWVARQLPAIIQLIVQFTVLALLYFGFQLINQFSIGFIYSLFELPAVSIILKIGFVYLIGLSIHHYVSASRSLQSSTLSSSHFIVSGLSGILQGAGYCYFFWTLHEVLLSNSYIFLNEVFFTNWNSNLVILASGGAFYALLSLNYYLLKRFCFYNFNIEWIPLLINVFTYLLTLCGIFFISENVNHSPVILLFAVIPQLISMLWLILQSKAKTRLVGISVLRTFLVLNVFFSVILFLSISFTYSNRIQERMVEAINEFQIESEQEVTNVTRELLSNAFIQLSVSDENEFEEIIRNSIKDEWSTYSISVQLIDSTGTLLSDYTTNLSAPQWSTEFRINELVIPFEFEQGRARNVRPIIRNRPINIINAEFSTFRRGWIPIFTSPDSNIISKWVLASVYIELPDPNRPLRTVIASSGNNTPDYSISVTEYQDQSPVRTSLIGIPITIPEYLELPDYIVSQLLSTPILFTQTTIQNKQISEVFVKGSNNSTYRAASIKPANTQLLYLFLRIYFSIIIPFLILLLIISSTKQWKLLAETRKFKDRLIDRFITASFLCLFVLVGVTFYILDRQNSTEVQDELLSRLNSFVQSIAIQDSASVADPEFLKTSSSILAEDVALFVDASLVNSTTPQIYSQHILPDVLPWTVFQNLTTTGSQQEIQIIQLNGQEMMIGYQPWLDANNKIVGVAAIPTFLRTPKFYEELLSTTSYLLAFFSIIFGLLMVSISVIASRMTSPLEALKLGLGKIASGDLEATLPVTSTDEIGMLTQAYNTMATRLKELQHELAESEREAAWKEMAQQVAHEIKNPLTPMKLNLQHLERQLSETEHQLEKTNPRIASITKSMIEQIEALNKIASDFSKFAKPIRKEFEVIDLNKLVSSVADLYEQELQIKVKPAPRKLFVYGVPDELRRVFVNLIKNAQEAIKEGGEIQIKAETDPAQHHALIHVTDTGKGISEEDQNKIFTPNFSTKTSGTGLGLAITKKIIEEHRGTISFSSEKNKATTFSVKIPLKLN